MTKLNKLWWILIIVLALNDIVMAVCIVTKDTPTRRENYEDCSRGYCRMSTRLVDVGPIEYSCSYTHIAEINEYSQRANTENKIFITDSDISSLKPDKYYWKSLIELHMNNTNTSEIVPGFFSKFDNLKILKITHNKLQTLIDGVFSSLTILTSLNLSSNCIAGLTSHSFSGLLNLEILDLSQNKITFISSKVFDTQNFLTHVDISQNLVKDVANILNKTSLQIIQLSNNEISEFDFEQLNDNSNLTVVDLSKNQIKSIKKVGNITNLNMSYNCLEIINNSMLNSYIRIIDLSKNKISIIAENSLDSMTNLEYLYLDHNNITLIPRESFKDLKNLKLLELSFNSINQMQFGLFNNLNKLIYLDLSNNNMILDFHTLITLQSLEVLKIQHNKIINFDAGLLVTRFKNLNYVSLGEDLWKCSELANTIHLLQINNVNISRGNNTKTNNILGMSCKDNVDLKEESIIFNRNNQTISDENTKDMKLSENRTIVDNSQITALYQILGNISRQLLKLNVSTLANNNDQNNFIQYLNQNFTSTNFYKYLEGLKQFQNSTNSSFSKMIKFFGEGFNQTNFYKYLNSLKISTISNISHNVEAPVMTPTLNQAVQLLISLNKTFFNMSENLEKNLATLTLSEHNFSITSQSNNTLESVSVDRKFESQALIDGHFTDDKTFRNSIIFTNIFLALILCSILAHLYYTFWRPKHVLANAQEQVQLM